MTRRDEERYRARKKLRHLLKCNCPKRNCSHHTQEELTIQCIEAAGNAIELAGQATSVTRTPIDMPAKTTNPLQGTIAPPTPILPRYDRKRGNLWGPTILVSLASIVVGMIVGVTAAISLY